MKLVALMALVLFVDIGTAQYTEGEWLERDSWMRVAELFDFAEIETGDNVADVGCHEGYLSMHLAKKVGVNGKVYAVDVKNYRLEALKSNAADRDLKNIQTVLGDYDNPKLPPNTFDAIFVVDTYHEMDSHEAILKHLKKALKSDGKLIVLEKMKARMRGKTRREQTNAHTLASSYVKKELTKAGFTIVGEVDDFGNWENEEDEQMWFVVAMKN